MLLELIGKLVFVGLVLALAAAAVGTGVAWTTGRRALARSIALVAVAAVALYGVALVGVSLTSSTRLIPPGVELPYCDMDCDLFYSVVSAGREPPPAAAPAGWVLWRVSVRARSVASRVTMNLSGTRVEAVDAAGHAWAAYAPPGGGAVPLFPRGLVAGASMVGECRFLLPPKVRAPRLRVGPGPWFTRFVLADEGSFLHHRTLFALDPADREADTPL